MNPSTERRTFADLDRALRIHASLLSYTYGTIFADGRRRPFDSYHYHYYAERAGDPAIENAREQMAWGHLHLATAMGGVPTLYLPEAITGGVDAHQLAMDSQNRTNVTIGKHTVSLLTTRDLGLGEAGKERLTHDVIEPNKRAALHHVAGIQKRFAGYGIVSPFDKEGMVRVGRSNTAVSFGRQPEEEDFMGGWYAQVDLSAGIVNFGDVAFSRNSNWENMRGMFVALGMMNGVVRENADFTFYRPDGSYSTLAERMEDQVAYLMYALENGFHAQEAATCLAWSLEIDRRLRDPAYNAATSFPIDHRIVSEQLRREFFGDEPWAQKSRAGIDSLRPVAEKLLLQYFASHIPERFMGELDERYRTAKATIGAEGAYSVPDQLEQLGLATADPLVARLLWRARNSEGFKLNVPPQGSLRAIATPAFQGLKMPALPHMAAMPVPQQIADKDNVFGSEYHARLFEDRPYDRLSQAEQIAVQQAVGAAMTLRPPILHPGWVVVLHDFRAGPKADELARELGADITKVQDALNDPAAYQARVMGPEQARLQDLIDTVRARHHAQSGLVPPLLSSFDVLAGHAAFDASPNLTAISSGRKQTNAMRLAMNLKMIDLFASELPLIEGWEKSPDQAQFVTRATLVQLGLVKRGYAHATNLAVTNHQGQEMSLYDRFAPLYRELRASVERGVPSKQHALAVARLVATHELLIDARQNIGPDGREIIDLKALPESVTAYRISAQRGEMDSLSREARAYVMEHCIDLFSPEDLKDFEYLDQDYPAAWRARKGQLDHDLAPDSRDTRLGAQNDPGSGPG